MNARDQFRLRTSGGFAYPRSVSWALAFAVLHRSAWATYSIVACDPQSGQCGVAVQTDNLAVGASVPFAQADVGAIASQFETNPRHGPRGLALLAEGKTAHEVLQQLLREDGNFEGRGIEARQIAIAAANGEVAVHTGDDAAQATWAGSRTGAGFSVQGNGLAGPQVLESMERAFLATNGPLADRLLAALSAGDSAGGQRTGRESAALLVRTREGFPLDIDLQVDHADDPVGELRGLYDLHSARQQIIAARITGRRGNIADARALLAGALPLAARWPRGGVLAAEVAIELEQPEVALECLTCAFAQNPARIATVLGRGTFALLGGNPRFHAWVTPDLARVAQAARDDSTSAVVLVEIGCAREALVLLERDPTTPKTAGHFLALATAREALGKLTDATVACAAGLEANPNDRPLTLRIERMRSLTNQLP